MASSCRSAMSFRGVDARRWRHAALQGARGDRRTSMSTSAAAVDNETPAPQVPEPEGAPQLMSGHKIWRLCSAGRVQEAAQMLEHMAQRGVRAPSQTYGRVLEHCAQRRLLADGRAVHRSAEAAGVELDIYLGNSLISMYGKCGAVADAARVFARMPRRDVVSWSAMIAAYGANHRSAEALELFQRMQREAAAGGDDTVVTPNKITFLSVLRACNNSAMLEHGRMLHMAVVDAGLASDVTVATALVTMYAKCGSMTSARAVFDAMPERNVISWSAVIQAYAQHGQFDDAFALFERMLREGVPPNAVTFVSILNVCTTPQALARGREIHLQIQNAELEAETIVANALITMYSKCCSIDDARGVFDRLPRRDVVSWSAMISGYAMAAVAHPDEALTLFERMQQDGVRPNKITFMSVLRACSTPAALEHGRRAHAEIRRLGFEPDCMLQTALLNMYANCGSPAEAEAVFDCMAVRTVAAWTSLLTMHVKRGDVAPAERVFRAMPMRNVVSWNVMIAGYVRSGNVDRAFDLFHEMQADGLKPDKVTVIAVLEACGEFAALERGQAVHAQAVELGLDGDAVVATALMGMYAKCGCVADARALFDALPPCSGGDDVITWNAMISGYAQHGDGAAALDLLARMREAGVAPNATTFTGVLSACSRAGLLREGRECFRVLQEDQGLVPTAEHYGCMVDLLARAGQLCEAERFIQDMPPGTLSPGDVSVWRALLGACKEHPDVVIAERAASAILAADPGSTSAYITLANVYAQSGRWPDAAKTRKVMEGKGLKKDRGRSSIEVGGRVHSFVAGDCQHPQISAIHAELSALSAEMRVAGYVPDMRFVLHDVDALQKEAALCHHSEKLAIAFGLLATPPGTPLRITKNLRVCGDCHTTTKLISKLRGRDIVARDAHRFHFFKDGVCSCGDFW